MELAQTVAGVLLRQVACDLHIPVALVNFSAWYPLRCCGPPSSSSGTQQIGTESTGYGDRSFKNDVHRRLLAKMGNFANQTLARDLIEQIEFLSLGEFRSKAGEHVFEAVSTIHDS